MEEPKPFLERIAGEAEQALLDRFAAAGLTGYLASCSVAGVRTPAEAEAARVAYNFAAAMMRERALRNSDGTFTPAELELMERMRDEG